MIFRRNSRNYRGNRNNPFLAARRCASRAARVVTLVALLSVISLTQTSLAIAVTARPASMMHGGIERQFLLYVPAGALDAKKPPPLVMVLHGGGGRASQIEWATHYRFNELADKHNFVVVYPNGVKRGWNDGRGDQSGFPDRDKVADVQFLTELIDHIATTVPIDIARIYTAGISNGGMMAIRLACATTRIRAIAAVVANMPEPIEKTCEPRGTSALFIHGTDDKFVPYAGGFVNGVRKTNERGKVISANDTFKFLGEANHCQKASSRKLPDLVNDDTRIVYNEFANCRSGTAVVQYRIEGGGHTWPGARTRVPKFLVGNSSRELDATVEIWRFFNAQK